MIHPRLLPAAETHIGRLKEHVQAAGHRAMIRLEEAVLGMGAVVGQYDSPLARVILLELEYVVAEIRTVLASQLPSSKKMRALEHRLLEVSNGLDMLQCYLIAKPGGIDTPVLEPDDALPRRSPPGRTMRLWDQCRDLGWRTAGKADDGRNLEKFGTSGT